jgi:predicted CopG family antitoxin
MRAAVFVTEPIPIHLYNSWNMSKRISVADDTYNQMKSKNGDRSFSDVIRNIGSGNLEELEGIGFSDRWGDVESAVNAGEEQSRDKIAERTA